MDRQVRYDVFLWTLPLLLLAGGLLTVVASGVLAGLTAVGTAVVAAGAVGGALFVSPPLEGAR